MNNDNAQSCDVWSLHPNNRLVGGLGHCELGMQVSYQITLALKYFVRFILFVRYQHVKLEFVIMWRLYTFVKAGTLFHFLKKSWRLSYSSLGKTSKLSMQLFLQTNLLGHVSLRDANPETMVACRRCSLGGGTDSLAVDRRPTQKLLMDPLPSCPISSPRTI
jgi:hypothetical protein